MIMPALAVAIPPVSEMQTQEMTLVTNTVAVTGIPKAFFQREIQNLLRAHFESYGTVNQWVPLPGFQRILVVYELADNAETAKMHSDPIIVSGSQDRYARSLAFSYQRLTSSLRSEVILRVYRADPNPLLSIEHEMPPSSFLAVPALEKNFLISPPGSPPVGWEPVVEEPPNSTPLADDLMTALQKLELSDRTRHTDTGLEILLDPTEGSGVGVYVQGCDDDDMEPEGVREEDWIYGETAPARDRWRPMSTAMPPLRSTIAV